MSAEAWIIFAAFWAVFVTTPGPNAVNCISNGMSLPFSRAMLGVLAILTQATAFLLLSALGVTALITASPAAFLVVRLAGAGVLIWLGIRGWRNAARPVPTAQRPAGHVYLSALAIATINPKSVAGYLAAFSQFVQPEVPIWQQMTVILPTALTITALSYTGFTLIGALMGRAALGAVFNTWVRRVMAGCFIIYGVALGSSALPQARG
ncbi:homoserine/homoserine lactone efflux protein [Cribrihabitans marinus]|jgi:homoserine/homoserine lactone efflux protein|uniref:Homoserine/homoserine lactone efflux protein n=1 Tax=Cribrihabitans marinus TaxID=1227549 RepID=A0A1H6XNB0_9RHOB|nr:LysE family translocator [Cribrihabitans marinus]GGH27746.1 homoserine/homoserine lactone efflux protein [Cribrihabitans marinus]SEJ30559.1 homoserine/homoserine lactone efflux protein [Cribrihabitans marinus]